MKNDLYELMSEIGAVIIQTTDPITLNRLKAAHELARKLYRAQKEEA